LDSGTQLGLLPAFGVLEDTFYFLRRSLAESTKKQYGRAWRRFAEWAIARQQQPLPTSNVVAANYIAALAKSSGSQHSCATFISASNFLHNALCLPPPCDGKIVAKTMQGIRKTNAAPAKQSKGLSHDVVKRLLVHLLGPGVDGVKAADALAPPQHRRTAVVAAVSFASLARYDDLRQLNVSQIVFLEDGDMLIRYGKTKTNAARNRDYTDRIAATKGIYCICRLVRAYVDKLPGDDPDFPFLPTCRKSRVWKHRASNNAAIRAFRAALAAIGEDGALYGLHSGRVGAQQALCEAGVPKEDCVWKARWAPGSRMYEAYIRNAPRKDTCAKTSAVLSLENGRDK